MKHAYLDVAARVESIQLVHNLKHSALHLVVPALPIIKSRATDAVNLIEEDEASLLGARHLEHLAHHARALAHVFLHQLRPHNSDEARVGAVGAGSCRQRLAGSRRTVPAQKLRRRLQS